MVWLAEGFIFSRFLQYSAWQTALMAVLYVALFLGAVKYFARFARKYTAPVEGISVWRLVSLAPMIAVILGSFISLPVLLLIAALGRVI